MGKGYSFLLNQTLRVRMKYLDGALDIGSQAVMGRGWTHAGGHGQYWRNIKWWRSIDPCITGIRSVRFSALGAHVTSPSKGDFPVFLLNTLGCDALACHGLLATCNLTSRCHRMVTFAGAKKIGCWGERC